MRRQVLMVIVLGATLAAGLAAQGNRAATGPCDRACLEGVMNQYLAAVEKHDPKGVPLSEDVKYTENDQAVELGKVSAGAADAAGAAKTQKSS